MAALFRMLYGLKQEIQNRIERGDTRDSEAVARTRDELAEFKLEVARTYVPLSLIRDVDQPEQRGHDGHLDHGDPPGRLDLHGGTPSAP